MESSAERVSEIDTSLAMIFSTIWKQIIALYDLSENSAMAEKATVVFRHFDANEDGQLNPQELQQFVHQMTNLPVDKLFTEQEQEQMFSNLDVDQNGALTQEGNLNAKIFTEHKW